MTETYSEAKWKEYIFFFRVIINKSRAHNLLLY